MHSRVFILMDENIFDEKIRPDFHDTNPEEVTYEDIEEVIWDSLNINVDDIMETDLRGKLHWDYYYILDLDNAVKDVEYFLDTGSWLIKDTSIIKDGLYKINLKKYSQFIAEKYILPSAIDLINKIKKTEKVNIDMLFDFYTELTKILNKDIWLITEYGYSNLADAITLKYFIRAAKTENWYIIGSVDYHV